MSLTIPVQEIVTESNDPLLAIHPSWERVPLSTIAKILNGFAFNSAFFNRSKGLPLLRIRDVGKDRTECFYDGDYEPRYIVQAGDLIIGMDGDFKCACWTGPDALLNQRVCKIELITRNYESSFLTLALPGYLRAINERTSSQTVKHLSSQSIAELPLPLPPLAEQKRIVAKVEESLARVNATKERLAKVSMILKRFRQAAVAAACSGRLTADWRPTQKELEPADQLMERIRRKYRQQYEAECNKAKREGKRLPKKPEILELRKVETASLPQIPDEWTWVYLPALGYMSRGKSKHRPRNAPHLYGGPYPFIQTGDIARSQGLITSHQQTYSEAGLAQSHLWPAGTICITIAANIANSAILAYPACFPDSVVGLISDETLCLKEYAEFFIRIARANLEQFAPATAQKNINIEILRDVAVPLPPLTEQKNIVRRVESMFKLSDTVEKRVAAATARAEKLTQAILAKAFRGEMVPTEAELARRERRSYETASQLLARIKSEKGAKQTSQKVHKSQNWE